jgi:hypothetical protein
VVRKRALAAGIMAPIGNHSFRATGITAYLANGGVASVAIRCRPDSPGGHAGSRPRLLAYIKRLQVPPEEVTSWARPHLENLGNSLPGPRSSRRARR